MDSNVKEADIKLASIYSSNLELADIIQLSNTEKATAIALAKFLAAAEQINASNKEAKVLEIYNNKSND